MTVHPAKTLKSFEYELVPAGLEQSAHSVPYAEGGVDVITDSNFLLCTDGQVQFKTISNHVTSDCQV